MSSAGKCFNNESTNIEREDKKISSSKKYASSTDEVSMNEEADVLTNEYEQNEDEILKIAEITKCEAEQSNIRDELKTMSFEQLMKLKQKLGSKLYNEAVFGINETKRDVKYKFTRETSNRPMEMSSKRQVSYGGTKKKTDELIADPRFNANCGVFNSTKFKKKYEFVTDMRESELKTLNMNLKNCVDADEATRIKFLIQRLKNQLHEEKRRKEKLTNNDNQTEHVDKTIDQNKNQFFIKPNLKKTEQMVKQYEELQRSGKLSKHLEKRRKKSMIKDRKKCTVL